MNACWASQADAERAHAEGVSDAEAAAWERLVATFTDDACDELLAEPGEALDLMLSGPFSESPKVPALLKAARAGEWAAMDCEDLFRVIVCGSAAETVPAVMQLRDRLRSKVRNRSDVQERAREMAKAYLEGLEA